MRPRTKAPFALILCGLIVCSLAGTARAVDVDPTFFPAPDIFPKNNAKAIDNLLDMKRAWLKRGIATINGKISKIRDEIKALQGKKDSASEVTAKENEIPPLEDMIKPAQDELDLMNSNEKSKEKERNKVLLTNIKSWIAALDKKANVHGANKEELDAAEAFGKTSDAYREALRDAGLTN